MEEKSGIALQTNHPDTIERENKYQDEFHSKEVALIGVAHGLHDMYSSFLSALLPLLKERLALNNTMAGTLSMIYSLPAIFQPVIGYLADRKNLRYLIIFAPFITSTVMCFLGYYPSFSAMIPFLLLGGISSSGLHSVGPGVSSHFSGKHLGKGISFWMIGGEFGYSAGPLLATTAAKLLGIEKMPLLAFGGLAVTIFLFFATKDVDTRSRGPAIKFDFAPFKKQLVSIMLPLFLLLIIRSLMSVMLSTFMPLFLTSEGENLQFAAAGMAIAGAAGVVGAYVAGLLGDRFGRRKILAGSLILTPIFMLLFLNVHGALRIVLLILSGFFGLALLPVMIAIVMEKFAENRSFANGIFMALNFIITALSAVVCGRLADTLGMRQTFFIAAIMVPFGLLILLMMPKDQEKAI